MRQSRCLGAAAGHGRACAREQGNASHAGSGVPHCSAVGMAVCLGRPGDWGPASHEGPAPLSRGAARCRQECRQLGQPSRRRWTVALLVTSWRRMKIAREASSASSRIWVSCISARRHGQSFTTTCAAQLPPSGVPPPNYELSEVGCGVRSNRPKRDDVVGADVHGVHDAAPLGGGAVLGRAGGGRGARPVGGGRPTSGALDGPRGA
eukprot:scaffold8217_cov54-Phaeocystis_antarctica.AAC.1